MRRGLSPLFGEHDRPRFLLDQPSFFSRRPRMRWTLDFGGVAGKISRLRAQARRRMDLPRIDIARHWIAHHPAPGGTLTEGDRPFDEAIERRSAASSPACRGGSRSSLWRPTRIANAKEVALLRRRFAAQRPCGSCVPHLSDGKWLLRRSVTSQVGIDGERRLGAEARAIDLKVLHHALHIVAGLHERGALRSRGSSAK